MRSRPVVQLTVVVCAFVGSVPLARAEELSIEHDAVECVVAERQAQIEARFIPEDAVARARVYFRAAGSPHWYSVEMRPDESHYRGVLPGPQASTPTVEYYVEVLDSTAAPTRTADLSARVVRSSDACGGLLVATVASAGKVFVGAPAGAPPLPAGFAAGEIVSTAATAGAATTTTGAGAGTAAAGAAAGGGISAGLLVGAGVAVAGAGVAVAAGGGGDDGNEGDGGGPGETSQLEFFYSPGMDVTPCGAQSLSGQSGVVLAVDGSFNVTGTPATPNLIRYVGRATATSLDATVTCASRPGPTGRLMASGANYAMSGTFAFGDAPATPNSASQGSLRVERSNPR